MMELFLQKLPPKTVRGSYDVNRNDVSDDFLPKRMLYMHPDAAQSLLLMEATIVLSDLFRSAEASLAARKRKRGVAAPAYSGHNFGLAFDVDIRRTLRENAWTYRNLLTYLERRQWYCYRRDGKRGREDWHFNYLGPEPKGIIQHIDPRPWLGRKTWKRAAEMAIQRRYYGRFELDEMAVQESLKKMRLYSGNVDGKMGPISRQSVGLFAKAWGLKKDHRNKKFQRVLAYVSANVKIVEAA